MPKEPNAAGPLRTIVVQLHARSAEIAGRNAVSVRVSPGATARDVKQAIASEVPVLAALLSSSALANEHDYLADKTPIDGASSLHLIPPVSGG